MLSHLNDYKIEELDKNKTTKASYGFYLLLLIAQ